MFVGALDNPLIFLVTIFDCFPCFRGVYIVGNMAKMRTSKRFLATTVARKQNTSVSKETSGMKWIKDFLKTQITTRAREPFLVQLHDHNLQLYERKDYIKRIFIRILQTLCNTCPCPLYNR